MIIGVPKEIKEKEFRVGIVPAGVKALAGAGHTIVIEENAGVESGISAAEYEAAGASLVASPEEVYDRADLIMKVKEPLGKELLLLHEGQILFTYLHLAPAPELTEQLLQSKIRGVAYETVQLDNGFLPLLSPMSQVAGRMAIQEGARFLEKEEGGRGLLLAGVPGVAPGHVTILGSGTVAINAAQIAIGLGANTTIVARNLKKLTDLDTLFKGRLRTLSLNQHNLEDELRKADLLVCGIYMTGARAPKLISRDMLGLMKKGSVIVDVAIDQGGCLETSHPTFHSDPVFKVDGILHYCVANMPGSVPWTSTFALTNATIPYCLTIANNGLEAAARENQSLYRGINVFDGQLVNRQVAESQKKAWHELQL